MADTKKMSEVFAPPEIIQIMRKYGLAGAVPAGMGALAAQDRYAEQ
jgi:hypothetical protein